MEIKLEMLPNCTSLCVYHDRDQTWFHMHYHLLGPEGWGVETYSIYSYFMRKLGEIFQISQKFINLKWREKMTLANDVLKMLFSGANFNVIMTSQYNITLNQMHVSR